MKLDPFPGSGLRSQSSSSRAIFLEAWCPKHGRHHLEIVQPGGENVEVLWPLHCRCDGASFYRHELRGTDHTVPPGAAGRALHASRAKELEMWLLLLRAEGGPDGEET